MNTDNINTTDMKPAEAILAETGRMKPGDLIPVLQKIQEAYGYLPVEVLKEISERTGIPTSRMYGVITFYAQFSMKPRGRHTIKCCRGTACHVRGGKAVLEAITRELNVEEGGTTADMRFTFEPVACLGTCFLAPVIMVDSQYFGLLTPESAVSTLKLFE